MTIQEARKLLGDEATNMTDEQVQELNFSMTALADIIIAHVLTYKCYGANTP